MILKTENSGIGIWFDIYLTEDMWFSTPELALKNNHLRRKKLVFRFTLIKWELIIEIPLKKVGYVAFGRDMTKIMEKKKLEINND